MNPHYLISLIIPFISVFLQSYPQFFNKYFGVDVWTRLLEIEHVRINHHRIPGIIKKGFIIEGYFDYPIVFPWLFSFFSKKLLLKIQGFVSPFFDSLQNILVFFICYQLTGSIPISLTSQLIYSLIPIIPIENSYLTPRSLGYLMFTLAFYPILLYQATSTSLYLVASLIFATLLFLTHRFALQSFIFICFFFTVINGSLIYLLILLTAFALACVLTKGYYLRVARGHLYNIYFWTKNYNYRFAHQVYGLETNKKMDWVNTIYLLLSQFSPIFLIVANVWVVSAFIYLYFFLTGVVNQIQNGVFFLMSLWVIFFYVLGAIILRVKILIPIGEGQRYLEMATVPASILSSVLVFYFYNLYGAPVIAFFALLLVGNLSMILFIQRRGIIKDKNRSLTTELLNVFKYINTLPGIPKLMCIPHQITTMTVYNTKADVLVNADNSGLMKISDFYPTIKKPVKELKKIYNLDYLLLRETFVKVSELKIRNSKVVFKSGNVLLIKL